MILVLSGLLLRVLHGQCSQCGDTEGKALKNSEQPGITLNKANFQKKCRFGSASISFFKGFKN
jgi:hypothetical protein